MNSVSYQTGNIRMKDLKLTQDGEGYAWSTIDCSQSMVDNLNEIKCFTYLTKLNVSHNQLRELSALQSMHYLMHLDASYNQLTYVFDFSAPICMQFLDLSHNDIQVIENCSEFWSLNVINLGYNKLNSLKNLHPLKYLMDLDVSHNLLEEIEGLDDLPITNLDLSYNQLNSMDGLRHLYLLTNLNLSHNRLQQCLEPLVKKMYLKQLDLSFNSFIGIEPIVCLPNITSLLELHLTGNFITSVTHYRRLLSFYMQQLEKLDGAEVTVNEKIEATLQFRKPLHFKAVEYQRFLRMKLLKAETSFTPSYYHHSFYPVLAFIVSPDTELELLIINTFKNDGRYFISHLYTTKCAERDGVATAYVHKSEKEFSEMLTTGKFILYYKMMGETFALFSEDFQTAAKCGKPLIVVLHVEGAFQFTMPWFKTLNDLQKEKSRDERDDENELTNQFIFLSTVKDANSNNFHPFESPCYEIKESETTVMSLPRIQDEKSIPSVLQVNSDLKTFSHRCLTKTNNRTSECDSGATTKTCLHSANEFYGLNVTSANEFVDELNALREMFGLALENCSPGIKNLKWDYFIPEVFCEDDLSLKNLLRYSDQFYESIQKWEPPCTSLNLSQKEELVEQLRNLTYLS